MRILDSRAARRLDEVARQEFRIPSLVLMENAAIAVVDALLSWQPDATRIGVLCGPGNNGGDGYAVARQLRTRGAEAVLFSWCDPGRTRGTHAELQRQMALACDIEERSLDAPAARLELRDFDVLIDALLGIGISRPLDGALAEIVAAVNAARRPVLAVDLPTGLDAGREAPIGPAIRADRTVTFVAPKVATVFPPARDLCGEVLVADLGAPLEDVEAAADEEGLELLTTDEAARWVMPRPVDSHKGDLGHLLIVAGSAGHLGAAVLAARGALRTGVGLLTVAAPAEAMPTIHGGAREAMTAGFSTEAASGAWAPRTVEQLHAAALGKTALAVGPGLGSAPATAAGVRELVSEWSGPLVLDADGLNAFAGKLEALAGRSGPTVMTPHPGEMGRLLGSSAAAVQSDRRGAARAAARRSGAVVILKGHLTLVASPEGSLVVCPFGNAGMASGGMGDVLTGVAGALLARGYDPFVAAQLAVYLHGSAGDRVAAERGLEGLLATDLAEELPAVWKALLAA